VSICISSIEWKAFDYDSGLNQVEWWLYNNYTGIEEHGKAAKPAQGDDEHQVMEIYHMTFGQVYCLFFYDIGILITPLVSSNSS
jgi:hypothetical protein